MTGSHPGQARPGHWCPHGSGCCRGLCPRTLSRGRSSTPGPAAASAASLALLVRWQEGGRLRGHIKGRHKFEKEVLQSAAWLWNQGISVQSQGLPAGRLPGRSGSPLHSLHLPGSPGDAPGPGGRVGRVAWRGELFPLRQAVRTGGWPDAELPGPAPGGSESFRKGARPHPQGQNHLPRACGAAPGPLGAGPAQAVLRTPLGLRWQGRLLTRLFLLPSPGAQCGHQRHL